MHGAMIKIARESFEQLMSFSP